MNISSNLNAYWLLLKDLDANEKLSLIELLVKSIKSPNETPAKSKKRSRALPSSNRWVYEIAGSWNDFPETAEEMIALTEGSRTLGRQIEPL